MCPWNKVWGIIKNNTSFPLLHAFNYSHIYSQRSMCTHAWNKCFRKRFFRFQEAAIIHLDKVLWKMNRPAGGRRSEGVVYEAARDSRQGSWSAWIRNLAGSLRRSELSITRSGRVDRDGHRRSRRHRLVIRPDNKYILRMLFSLSIATMPTLMRWHMIY